MIEAIATIVAALAPEIAKAVAAGHSHADILKAIEASMVAASDAEMLRELGPDAPPGTS